MIIEQPSYQARNGEEVVCTSLSLDAKACIFRKSHQTRNGQELVCSTCTLSLSEICQLLDVKGTCIAHSFPDRGTDKMRDSRIAPDATCYFSLYLAVYVLGGQQNVGWYIVDVYWLAGRTFRARAAALRNGSLR